MAKMGYVQNGVTRAKKNGSKARKNPSLSKARVTAFAKKNGLKLVSKTAANPKRRRKHSKRRNGLATIPRTRNGILGNSKSDVKQVVSLGGGAMATKAAGRILNSFVAPYLSQVGAGQFSEIACDAVLALFLIPMLAGKVGGSEAAKFARLGGLLAVGLDAIEMIAPQAMSWNPFNTSPVVMADGKPLVTPKAVAQIVAQTDASSADKAKVAGAMAALDAGVPIDMAGGSGNGYIPVGVNE